MKFLALDYGQKRTGIAVSDAGERMAFPKTTLIMRTRGSFFDSIRKLIDDEVIEGIVVGLPLLENGEDSLTTRQVRNMVKSLQRRTTLPIFFMEEFLSSFEATKDMHAIGHYGRAMKKVLDQQAAVRILDSFLNQDETLRRPV